MVPMMILAIAFNAIVASLLALVGYDLISRLFD
jgi:hypothetical protein